MFEIYFSYVERNPEVDVPICINVYSANTAHLELNIEI